MLGDVNNVAVGLPRASRITLDQIERWRKPDEQVCIVTFNYDSFLEDALPVVGVKIEN